MGIINTPYTTKDYIAAVQLVHNNKYLYDKTEYTRSHEGVIVTCPKHGDFKPMAYMHLQGLGCPICAKLRKRKKVYGVGINDMLGSEIYYDEIRKQWNSMLGRCYDEKLHKKQPTYIGCSVCESWIYLSSFYNWMMNEAGGYRKGYMVDKDILYKGNKIYSPETCCLVPNRINCLILNNKSSRGNLPIGVCKEKRGFQYRAYYTGRKGHTIVGFYYDPIVAFNAYKQAKEAYIREVATDYYSRGLIADNVYNALMNWTIEITD